MNKLQMISALELLKASDFDDKKASIYLDKAKKITTMLNFEDISNKKSSYNQKEICDTIGVSVSTINRMRKDLGISSPYRYTTSIRTEEQKEKDKYKRKVYNSFKSGLITEIQKNDFYDKINSNLTKELKDQITLVNNNQSSISKVKKSKVNTNKMKGGSIEPIAEPLAEPLENSPEKLTTRKIRTPHEPLPEFRMPSADEIINKYI